MVAKALRQPQNEPDKPGRIRTALDLRSDLKEKGYCFCSGRDLILPAALKAAPADFIKDAEDLPPDEYDETGTRFRRFSEFLRSPIDAPLAHLPDRGYWQDPELNWESAGALREFEGLTKEMRANPALAALIEFASLQTSFREEEGRYGLSIGVHVIKLQARPGVPGVAMPNRPHKDGELYTAILMLAREAVSGGESRVFDNDLRPLFRATLTEPLDMLIVHDPQVYHQVMPVHVLPGASEGYRTVLLIDFTPLKRAIVKPPASQSIGALPGIAVI